MAAEPKAARRPRFRRASEPPSFRVTDDDILIIRHLARHRFLRSTHIATLVGRSVHRTNYRLTRLFHAGYVDRPRAQLDRFPTGSAPIAYALADRGAQLLVERYGGAIADVMWSRKNRAAGRPFIEHQLEIIDFWVALQTAAAKTDARVLHPDDLVAQFASSPKSPHNPFTLHARLSGDGAAYDVAVVPDFAFGLAFPDGTRRCFLVEIDRGTMPIVRADIRQTSFARKLRGYLAAYAAKQHQRQFNWKAFRVLTVTPSAKRLRSMQDAAARLHVASSPGAALFFFATRTDLAGADPLASIWHDGNGRDVRLL